VTYPARAGIDPLKAIFIVGAGIFVLGVVVVTAISDQFQHHSVATPATVAVTALRTTTTAPPEIDAATLSQLESDVRDTASTLYGIQIAGFKVAGSEVDILTPLYRKDGNVSYGLGLCNTAKLDLDTANVSNPAVFVKAGDGGDLAYSMLDDHCNVGYGLHDPLP
jgi:hypothetical protein